jgi:hypothetical protein
VEYPSGKVPRAMAENLLNANTVNFLELVGNGRTYVVPPYQRDYSWEQEQWEDLWEDILELRQDPARRHYLGAIVLQSTSDREFRVIDGQQRIATLSVLALAIIGRLEELAGRGVSAEDNLERARGLRNRFIGEKDPAYLTEQSKLTLNVTDDGIYRDYMVQGKTPTGIKRLPKSNQLLLKALEYFKSKLDAEPSYDSDGQALASLLSETAARGLVLIRITVEDELSAYTVFETLNARGLELSTTDLLKNFLFARMASGDLSHLQNRWTRLIQKTTQERFPEFLRYHMLCTHRQVRKERLFKMVRSEVTHGRDVLNLLDELDGRAEVFSALSDRFHEIWQDQPAAKEAIRELNLFGVRQFTPVVFAAYEKFNPLALTSVLRMLVVISFRFTVVSRLNSRDLEPIFSRAARAILEGNAKTPAQVFAILNECYVSDEKFRTDFSELTLTDSSSRKRLLKYILLKLEGDATGRNFDYETDAATIEHILPENPGDCWTDSIPMESWDRTTVRLGNLVPLELSLNRAIGNSPYAEKVAAYGQSAYALARAIALDAPTDWTEAHVEKRQAQLAERAVHIWRCDY